MRHSISAVITGAGNGKRMGFQKMLAVINGRTVLWHTLHQFISVAEIEEIIVTAKQNEFEEFTKIINEFPGNIQLVEGGSQRVISLFNGVTATKGEYIVTHDGCRPFTKISLIQDLIEEVKKYDAVMTAVHPVATVKYGRDGFIEKTFLRSETWIAQTPQAFKRDILENALQKAIHDKFHVPTDDSELVARTGYKVKIIEGHETNMKITYPSDLIIAKNLVDESC